MRDDPYRRPHSVKPRGELTADHRAAHRRCRDEQDSESGSGTCARPTHSCARNTHDLEHAADPHADPPHHLPPNTQRAELNNAFDKLRATRQTLDAEKSLTASLTAKLSTSAKTFRAIGQTFNAVRRGVEKVSETMATVECRGNGEEGKDPGVEEVARLVGECVHRDAFAKRRANALLGRMKQLAGSFAKERAESHALVQSLQTQIDGREEYIVHLRDLVAQSVSVVSMGVDVAAVLAVSTGPDSNEKSKEKSTLDDSVRGELVARLAAHRADLFLERTKAMVVGRAVRDSETEAESMRDTRDTNQNLNISERDTNLWTSRFSKKAKLQKEDPIIDQSFVTRFADDAALAKLVAERNAANTRADRASILATTCVDTTSRLLDTKNKEYQSQMRKRFAQREAAKRERDEKNKVGDEKLLAVDDKKVTAVGATLGLSSVPVSLLPPVPSVPLFHEPQSRTRSGIQTTPQKTQKTATAQKEINSPPKLSPLRLAMREARNMGRKTVSALKKNSGLFEDTENVPANGTGVNGCQSTNQPTNSSDPFSGNFNSSCES